MKKKLLAWALALTILLGCVTVGWAGSLADPLISLSYLTGTFYDGLKACVTQWIAQDAGGLVTGAEYASEDGWTVSYGFVPGEGEPGGTVTLTEGSGLIWNDGVGTVSSGVLVDATDGAELAAGDALTAGHRYLAGSDTVVLAASQARWMAEGKWLLGAGEAEIGPLPFTDVPEGAWYADSVTWAVKNSITTGTNAEGTTFDPARKCTETEILTFLYRAERGDGTSNGGDMEKAVNWAREMGLIGADYNGATRCTRATAVWYIWKVLGADESAPAYSFTDVDADADYAAAVNWAVASGITNGTNDGSTFSPDATCDRSQIVTFLCRAYGNSAVE